MGGNALSNPSVRLKKEVYDKVWKAIEIPLKEIFSRVEIIKAYSEKERSSFKSFTDMAYGYYDKDTQSQSTNLW